MSDRCTCETHGYCHKCGIHDVNCTCAECFKRAKGSVPTSAGAHPVACKCGVCADMRARYGADIVAARAVVRCQCLNCRPGAYEPATIRTQPATHISHQHPEYTDAEAYNWRWRCNDCKAEGVALMQPCSPSALTQAIANSTTPFPGERGDYPVFSGLLNYFPMACAEVARCSKVSNDKHNPGEPMHWNKSLSVGNGDQVVRHLMDGPGKDAAGVYNRAYVAWRALELLERELMAERGQS